MVVLFAAFGGYLVDAALVASAVEGCRQKYIYNLKSHLGGDEARRKHQNIGIVVGAGEAGKLRLQQRAARTP